MNYNCEKNVVSDLWKGRVMLGDSVLQGIKTWIGIRLKESAGMIILSLAKSFSHPLLQD